MKTASLPQATWRFPFSPSDIQGGPVYEFSIYHLIEANDALRFDFHIEQVTPEGVQA